MICVKTLFNTEADGTPVAEDVAEDVMPTCYHGPFETMEDAEHWMNHIYPDGDTDVYEQTAVDLDQLNPAYLNDPGSLFSPTN